MGSLAWSTRPSKFRQMLSPRCEHTTTGRRKTRQCSGYPAWPGRLWTSTLFRIMRVDARRMWPLQKRLALPRARGLTRSTSTPCSVIKNVATEEARSLVAASPGLRDLARNVRLPIFCHKACTALPVTTRTELHSIMTELPCVLNITMSFCNRVLRALPCTLRNAAGLSVRIQKAFYDDKNYI